MNNEAVALLMKAALEFNANIVALAASYYGNINSTAASKRFYRDYKKQVDTYKKALKSIEEEYEQA